MNTNDKLRELIRSPLSTGNPSADGVTQADRDAAMALLNHAFRNAPDECTQDVEFDDIAAAFARHRQQAVTPLEAERASVLQNKRVNDAIQTAFEKGELTLSSDGYYSPPKHDGGRGEPVALLHEHPNGDRELELYRFGAGCLTIADKAAGWTEAALNEQPGGEG